MLRNSKDMEGFIIGAIDGDIGHAKDFYFDDEAWTIRYLVVETGNWLASRRVLISPMAINGVEWPDKRLTASITRQQVKDSPDIDTNKPVSRQHEIQYFSHYGYPYYWGGPGLWGANAYPSLIVPEAGYGLGFDEYDAEYRITQAGSLRAAAAAQHQHDDPHLRSSNEILSYHLHASDGDIGRVQGLLIDEQTWSIRYLIVNTSNWWLGHRVLIAPYWIDAVNWDEASLSVGLTRQAVKDSPAYDASVPLDREHEMRLYQHYGRVGYWASGRKRESAESVL
jgi:hypothetical protein